MAKKLTKKELEVTSTLYQKYSAIDRRVHELNKAANRAFLEYIEVESALNKQRAKLEEKYGAVRAGDVEREQDWAACRAS